MKILANGKYVARDAGGTWPLPMDGGPNDDSVEWILRYASKERVNEVRFLAASILSAYRELIWLPQVQRNAVIRDLRAAIRTARETGAEHGRK